MNEQRRIDLVSAQGRQPPGGQQTVGFSGDPAAIAGTFEDRPPALTDDGQATPDAAQSVRDIKSLMGQLATETGPDRDLLVEDIRAKLNEIRFSGDGQLDSLTRDALDDFCSTVESKLALIQTEGADDDSDATGSAGEVGSSEHVGKSLGEIVEGWFPDLHHAGAWPFPQKGAPGSGLSAFYLAARRTKRMAR